MCIQGLVADKPHLILSLPLSRCAPEKSGREQQKIAGAGRKRDVCEYYQFLFHAREFIWAIVVDLFSSQTIARRIVFP